MSENKKITYYLISLFIISYVFQGIVLCIGGLNNDNISILLGVLMFFPAIAAVIFVIITKEGIKSLGLKIRPNKWCLYGIFIPVVFSIILIVIQHIFGIGNLKYFKYGHGVVTISKYATVLGGVNTIPVFIINMILTIIISSISFTLVTAGEEIGWRGYLQPKLTSKYGFIKGNIILGLVWGYWHAPIILAGYNYPENPILGALILMPTICVLFSIILGYLREKSKSIWPAALAHASINMFAEIPLSHVEFNVPRIINDLLVIVLWFIIALIIIKKINKESNKACEIVSK